ncbi:OmpH family outer membrane protein [Pseudotabrizicola sp. 4114]|uniref:OmpH family outer membrane protein n=1 Tax=Pseudotabrizicola sp. 4114 TaxID=2817731 RepID=UPI0028639D4A|nr:Skp family chaperone for outer membrane proteins [Pseudorhodobacter sp. 4114]
MRRSALRGALVAGLAAVLAGPLPAQEAEPVPPLVSLQSAVVTLDRNRLFEETRMGQAILARLEAASNDLMAENRRLEAALEAEERQMTERRATLPTAQFRELAQEFDTRVEELRVTQEAKSRGLTRQRDIEQQRFLEASAPVLADLMQDLGAVAIIDRSVVVLSFDRFDITAQAIARLDAELGDGADLVPAPEAEPEPGQADEPPSAPAQP